MDIFNKYNFEIYNAVYKNKDYADELNQLEFYFNKHKNYDIKNIIDLGCGTGNFSSEIIKRGYELDGVDLSDSFVEYIKKNNLFNVFKGDITTFHSSKEYDAAISMFHVVSYLPDLAGLNKFLNNTQRLLKLNGLLIFDFWNSACVLSEKPQIRSKNFKLNDFTINRIVKPITDKNKNIVNVNLNFKILSKSNKMVSKFEENHSMQHYSLDVMKYFCEHNGFEVLEIFNIQNNKLSINNSWGLTIVLKKIK